MKRKIESFEPIFTKSSKNGDENPKKRKKTERKKEKACWTSNKYEVWDFVIKRKLEGILHSDTKNALLPFIQDLVRQSSFLAHEVSYFANALIAFQLEHNKSLNSLFSQSMQQFYLNCIHLFTSNQCKHPEMNAFFEVYTRYTNAVTKKEEYSKFFEGLSTIKATIARQMATNANVSLFYAIESRIKAVMKYEFCKLKNLKKSYKPVLEKFVRLLLNDSRVKNDIDEYNISTDQEIQNAFSEMLNKERSLLYEGMPKHSIRELEHRVENVFRYYKNLLERSNRFAEEKSSSSENTRKPKVKRFSYLPLRSFQLNSILIDTNLLYSILKKCNLLPEEKGLTMEKFGNHESTYWSRAFNLKGFLKGVDAKKTFAYALHTDGVQVSIHMWRRGSKIRKKKKEIKKKTFISKAEKGLFWEKNLEIEPEFQEPIISVDPGYHVMLQCYNDSNEETFRMTRRNYEFQTRMKKQRKIKEEWMRQDEKNQEALRKMHLMQFKVSTFSAMQQSFEVKTEIEGAIRDHYCSKKGYRNLKFQLFRFKQRVMDTFCNSFKEGSVVAYGSAKFSISKKGDIQVPQKEWITKLSKRCRVVLTSEFLTSQKCCKCEKQTNPLYPFLRKMDTKVLLEKLRSESISEELLQKTRRDEKRGLRRCDNGCTRFLHRDINAAKNIRNALLSRIRKGIRPEYLCSST
jgi:hypothetical protein